MKNLLFLIIVFLFDSIACSAQYTHAQTGWTFSTSMNQCFYMFKPVHINGGTPMEGINNSTTTNDCLDPFGNCDVVASFVKKTINSGPNINTDTMVCTGWAYYVMDNGGYHTVYSAGNDMVNTYYYADMGDSVYFKIFQASSGIIFDAESTIPVPSWTSNMMNNIILMDTLQANTAITGLEPKYDISDEIILFPNPAMQNSEISLNIKKGSLEVYGINGKLCVSKEINTHTIALTDLSLKKGIYFLRLTSNQKVYTKRLIINN